MHDHRNIDTQAYSAAHSQRLLSKAFNSTSSGFFFSLFSQTAVHCFFLDTQKKRKKTLIYDYSLKEPWITTVLSTLSELMVCRKLWKHRWRKESERWTKSQQLSGIINLAIYPPVWTVGLRLCRSYTLLLYRHQMKRAP